MIGPADPSQEISELLRSDSTPTLLKQALELFMAAGPGLAREVADKLDELCERRFAFESDRQIEQSKTDLLSASRTTLNDRCDALTGRLMKFSGKLVQESQQTGESRLVLFASARSFICTCASVSGVEEGLSEARLLFEDAMKELEPILREMPKRRV